MSEKQFILCQDDLSNYEIRYDDKVFHFLWEVAPILNEQQSEIQKWKKLYELQDIRYTNLRGGIIKMISLFSIAIIIILFFLVLFLVTLK